MGSSGDGTGGASGGGGDGGQTGAGTGGELGTGVGGSNNGGVGGVATGTGGQTGGGTNLVMNGDFSNGETSWGIPSMMGSVSHAVTDGRLLRDTVVGGRVRDGRPSGGRRRRRCRSTGGTSLSILVSGTVSASDTNFEAPRWARPSRPTMRPASTGLPNR